MGTADSFEKLTHMLRSKIVKHIIVKRYFFCIIFAPFLPKHLFKAGKTLATTFEFIEAVWRYDMTSKSVT